MAATAEYLSTHPFASPDIVNPPEAPTYRYRPDLTSTTDLAGVETIDLSAGSRIDIVIDDVLNVYILQDADPTGSDLEVVPDDYDATLNNQYWLLVSTSSTLGSLTFADIGGLLSIDQMPLGTVVSLDSIGESGFYFFDNDLFVPELIGKDAVLTFLLPDQTGNDGKVLQTNAGILSWETAGSGSAWGDLTGTLSDQTDLQAALDAKQPLDSDLTTLASLVATTDNFIVSVSSAWSSRTPTQVKTTLGLVIGTNVQAWDSDLDTWATKTPYAGTLVITTGKTVTVSNTVTFSATDGSTLAIGAGGTLGSAAYTSSGAYQPLDSDLTAVAALTTDSFGLALLTKTSAANIRTYIGCGTSSFDGAFSSLTGTPTTLSGYGITDAQPLDSDLTTIAGLTATTDNFIVSVSSAWASRTPSQVRTTLGLVIGTNVQAWDADLDTLAGLTATTDNFVVSVSSAWASRTPSQVRTTLGLVIGTNVQAWDTDLDSWAAITRASGFDTFTTTPSSANFASLLTDESGSSGGFVRSGGGALTALTGLAIRSTGAAFDLTFASSEVLTAGRTLSIVMGDTARTLTFAGNASISGTNTGDQDLSGYQPLDSDLTTIAGLTATTNNFLVSVSSAWASRTPTQVRTTLALTIGTDVQAWDADLDSWAAITRASGFDTFSTTATSANLRALLSDELGTGAALFDGPTMTKTMVFAACTTSIPSFNITAGTLQTTPSDGDFEVDASCFYGCTDSGNRGYIPIRHLLRAASTVTQANDNSAHSIFTTPTNGRITLESGVYRFYGILSWSSMSATSGNLKLDILGAGTATIVNWLWTASGNDAAAGGIGTVGTSWHSTSASGASILAVSTATTLGLAIHGTFEVTGVGTLIPTQTLVTASPAVLGIGSMIELWRVGVASMTTIGQWD